MDEDGNGYITKSDLELLMVECGCEKKDAIRHITGFYKKFRMSETESVSFNDFLEEYIRMLNFISMKAVHALFAEADKDKNGSISKDEYLTILTKLMGETQAKQQIDRLFDETDADHSGGISLQELARWYFQHEQLKSKLLGNTVVSVPVQNPSADEEIVTAQIFFDENAQMQAKMQEAFQFQQNDQESRMQAEIQKRKAERLAQKNS